MFSGLWGAPMGRAAIKISTKGYLVTQKPVEVPGLKPRPWGFAFPDSGQPPPTALPGESETGPQNQPCPLGRIFWECPAPGGISRGCLSQYHLPAPVVFSRWGIACRSLSLPTSPLPLSPLPLPLSGSSPHPPPLFSVSVSLSTCLSLFLSPLPPLFHLSLYPLQP